MRARIIAAMTLALCSPALAQTLQPPPTRDDVAVHVTAAENGGSVAAQVGQAVAVELQASASAGSSWRVAAKPDFLADPEQLSGPVTAPAPGGRPLLGAPRWQVFVFPVTDADEGALTLEKIGPGAAGVVDTFSVTIVAQ